MTVIAYDGEYLVADGRATRGTSLVSDDIKKLHKVNVKDMGTSIVALCGALDVLGPYLAHLETVGLTTPMEHFLGKDEDGDLEMRGLLVNSDKECYEFSTSGGYFPINSPIAIGSGSWIAQHFLFTGHNAIKAVQEACKTELTCGGKIAIYDIKSQLFDWK